MRIEIKTTYLPRITAWHLRKALKWINRSDLQGLDCVRLMDYEPEDQLEFRAYILNHDNGDAWQAYLQDKEAILTKTPSALTDAERLWVYHRRVASQG